MCGRNCCGAFWNVVLVLVLVAAVACPWYGQMAEAEIDREVSGNWTKIQSCSVYRLTSWRVEYCAVVGDCANVSVVSTFLKDLTCPKGESYNWRDEVNVSHRANSYDIGVGLCVLSLVCAFLSCLGFFIRCCCRDSPGKSYLLITVALFGFLFLGASVVYFGLMLPGSFTDDKDCSSLPTDSDQGPCYKFFGKEDWTTPELLSYRGAFHVYWGPIGWAVGVVGLPIYLIVLCLSCTRAGGYNSINDTGNKYQRYDATGANYV